MPRIRLAPQLSEITLDHILSGETCEPISLADFEAYLTYKVSFYCALFSLLCGLLGVGEMEADSVGKHYEAL